ncbi:MAG: hypothetical protein AAF206_09385, partial [Bacteroidota bacterium]
KPEPSSMAIIRWYCHRSFAGWLTGFKPGQRTVALRADTAAACWLNGARLFDTRCACGATYPARFNTRTTTRTSVRQHFPPINLVILLPGRYFNWLYHRSL